MVHCSGRSDQRGDCLSRDVLREHHGLRSSAFQFLHRAALRDGHPRHALETRDWRWRLLGASCGNRILHRHVGVGQDYPAALRYVALSPNARDMAENMYRALWSWIVCVVVTVVVSYMTKAKSDAELSGLVYGVTAIPHEAAVPVYHRPAFWATVVAVFFVAVNILFW